MACLERNLNGYLKNTTTEELHPAQDDSSFLKCCNERSNSFLDKLSLRPVERFLKEVAQSLGVTVLESNRNVINCIPLNETELEQNIHHLEQLLHEARTYSSEKFDEHPDTNLHRGHMIREHLDVSSRDIYEQKNDLINCDKIFVFKTKGGDFMKNRDQEVVDYNSIVTSKEVKSSVENQEVQNESVHTLEVEKLEKSDEIPKKDSVKLPYIQPISKQVFDKPDSEEPSLEKNKEDLHKNKHLRFSKMRSEVDFSGYVHHNSNHKHRRKYEKSNSHKIEGKPKTLNSNYLLTGQHDKNYVVDSLYREQLRIKPYGTDFSHIDIDNMLLDSQEHSIMSPNLTIKRKYSDPVCHDVEKMENVMRLEDNVHDENLIMPKMECSNVSSNEMVRDHGDSDYNETRSQIMAKAPLNAMEPLLYKRNIDQYGLYDIIPMKQKKKHVKKNKLPRQDPLLYNPVASHHTFVPVHRKRNKKQDYMECDYIHELPCDYTKCTIPNDIDINNYSDELEEMDHCSVVNASSLENIVKDDTKYKPLRPHRIKRKVNNNIHLKDRSISDFYEELYDDVNNKVMKNVIRSYALNRSIKKSNTKETGVCVSGSSIANYYKTISVKRNQEVQMDEKQVAQNKTFSVGTECAFPNHSEQKLERELLSNDTSMRNPREQILEIKHLLTSCLKELITDTKPNEPSQTDMYKCCSSSKCCCTLEDSFSHTYIELPSVTCKQCNKRGDCTFQNSESCQNYHHSHGKSPASIFHDYLISNPPVNNKNWKGYDCDTRHFITRSTQLSESCKSIRITNSVNNTSVKVYDDARSTIHKEITIDGHTYILLDHANKSCKANVKNDTKDDSSERMSRQCCGHYSKKKRTSNTYPNNYIEIEKDKYLQTDFKSTEETISTAKCSIKDQSEKKVSAISIGKDTNDINAINDVDTVELQSEPYHEPAIENLIPDTKSLAHVEKPNTESSAICSPESPLKRLKLKTFIKKEQLEHKVAALPRDEIKVKPINNIYNCIKEYLKKRYKLTTRKYVESQREHIPDHCNEQKNSLLGDMGELDLIKMRLNQCTNMMTPNINSNKVSIFDTFRFDYNCVSYKPEFSNSCFDNFNSKSCKDTLDTNQLLNLQSQRKPASLLYGLMNAKRTIPNDYIYRRQIPVPIYSPSAINISNNNCNGGQSRIFLVPQKSELVLDSNLMLKRPEINKESDDDISRTSERQTSFIAKIIETFRKPRYRERRKKILDTAYKNENFGSTLSGNPSSRMYAYVKTPVCVMPLQRWNSYPNHTMESQQQKRCVSHESTFRTDKKKKHKQKPPLKRNFFDFKGKNIKEDTAFSTDTSDDTECDLELAKEVISRQMRNRKYYSDNEVGKMKRSSVHMSKKRSKGKSTKQNKHKEIGVQAKVRYPQIKKTRSPGAKMDKTGDTLRESIEKFWLSTLQSDKKQKKPFSRRKKYKSPFANPLYAMMRTMQGREAKFRIPKTRVKPII